MKHILKLIRINNLIFVGFTQYVMRQFVLLPILQQYGFEIDTETNMHFLLIIATVFIAAGGYVLNDYFDVKIDAINRPSKQIVGSAISRNTAMIIHQVLTGIGVFCGLLLSFFAHSITLSFIFIVVPGLLWFYSASYKRQFIIGNLVVAFIAALSVLIVGISEIAFLQREFGKLIFETPIPTQIYSWIGGFALFSFLCTWIREIIKDIEDEKGDREMECRTMPIKWGINNTKLFIYLLVTITTASLYIINEMFIPFAGSVTLRYISFGITVPFIALIIIIATAKTNHEFHQASTLSKVIMLFGVLYSFIFYYLQAKTHGLSLFNMFIIK